MKKKFDCVEMKQKVQEQVYKETHKLSRDEELEYFHHAADKFWEEINRLRSKPKKRKASKKKRESVKG